MQKAATTYRTGVTKGKILGCKNVGAERRGPTSCRSDVWEGHSAQVLLGPQDLGGSKCLWIGAHISEAGALVGCCWYASKGAGGWGKILQWGTSDRNSKRREWQEAVSVSPSFHFPGSFSRPLLTDPNMNWLPKASLQSVVCRVLAPTPDESRTGVFILLCWRCSNHKRSK